jgi:L-alanine-DL-glutamate epimerase-like enolase superfamily enzyme
MKNKNTKQETKIEEEHKIDPKFKRFYLKRIEDETGISGTGYVAEGIQFSDGTCVLHWLTTTTSTGIYHSIVEMEYIHGHRGSGKTVVIFQD